MDMVNVTIDGRKLQVPKSATVLTAAKASGINVPSLCYHPELRPEGACRVCVVEVEGAKSLVASCVYPVNEGMVVHTNTPAVREARKMIVELLLANHPQDCLSCQRSTNCELQDMAADLGIRKVRFDGVKKNLPLDNNNPALVRDQNKCILCGRCIKACSDRQGVDVYSFAKRGFDTTVTHAFDVGLELAPCTYCGQCASVCPTAAIVEKDDTQAVWDAIGDPTKHVIVQTAPATRVALGEALGMNSGHIVTGKMVSSLRRLGFDKVFDTDFTADLTILEEGHELLHRLQTGGQLPMITSCSPAGSISLRLPIRTCCRIFRPPNRHNKCLVRWQKPIMQKRPVSTPKTSFRYRSCPVQRKKPKRCGLSFRITECRTSISC